MKGAEQHIQTHQEKVPEICVTARRELYRQTSGCVKWTDGFWAPRGAFGAILCFGLCGGCIEPGMLLFERKQTNSHARQAPAFVIYDVALRRAGSNSPEAFAHQAAGDFETIARLGFDGVMLRQVSAKDVSSVSTLANAAVLAVYWEPPELTRYIRTRWQDTPLAQSIRELGAAALPDAMTFVVDGRGSAEKFGRAKEVASLLNKVGLHRVIIQEPMTPIVEDQDNVCPVVVVLEDAGRRLAGDMLKAYHRGMLKGCTGPLIVERFQNLPGDGPGVFDAVSGSDALAKTALKALLERHRRWGESLAGAKRPAVKTMPSDLGVEVEFFKRGSRAFALVFNTSEVHVRQSVSLAAPNLQRKSGRAVEIPASGILPAGRVFPAKNGDVSVQVSLVPGDAMLFELF